MKTHHRSILAIVLTLALLPCLASAGEWGIGTAIAHLQPPQRGVASEFLSVPYLTYHSERLNVDLATVSYRLRKSGKFEIAAEGEFRFDGYDPKDSQALSGMERRKPTFDAGVSLAHKDRYGEMKIMLLADVTGTHEGVEAKAQYQKPYLINRFFIAPAVGISRQNSSLVDYYYGVRLNEATISRSHYVGEATTNTYLELNMGYILSDQLELLGGLKLVRFGEKIYTSPIVESQYETSLFSALQYKF